MNIGELWERNLILDTRKLGHVCYKIPESVKVTRTKRIIRNKTPFDIFFSVHGVAGVAECKATIHHYWNAKVHLRPHQLESLRSAWSKGTVAGVFIWWRNHNAVSWANMDAIEHFLRIGKSLKPDSPELTHQKYLRVTDIAELCRKDIDAVRKQIALQVSLDKSDIH